MYSPNLNLEELVAIDAHVHIEVDAHGHPALPTEVTDAASAYFGAAAERPDLEAVADYYRERRTAAVVFTVDAETQLGHAPVSSEEIAGGAARNNDILIPFGSVDPNKGDRAIEQARRLVTDFGVRGFKFHPTVQHFNPSDERWFPLWAQIEELGVPALFHTGQTGIGAGMPGGNGFELALSNPMLLDIVAARFPQLQVILAHPSVPWQDEQLSILTHKPNAWMDLSGWRPKYFSPDLVRQMNSFLQGKIMFGSDFPLITPDRWRADFDALDLKPEVREKVLRENVIRLLGLGQE